MKKDSKEYKEKMKAFYKKVAGISLLILDQAEQESTPPSKTPVIDIKTGKPLK
jgi:hypothetical protein